MASKKEAITSEIKDIKKALGNKEVLIGSSSTIKSLKKGNIKKIFLSSNCPSSVKEDIINYSKISKVPVVELAYPNDELGTICKKSFSVSVLSLIKGA